MQDLQKDWIQNVYVCDTVGGDIQVRLDGSSVMESHNKYGGKGRHSFMIGEGFNSKEEATKHAIEWLEKQIKQLKENN